MRWIPVILLLTFITACSRRDEGVSAIRMQLTAVAVAINTFEIDSGRFPTNIQELVVARKTPMEGPPGSSYLEPSGMVDSWGNILQYKVVGNTWEVRSAGPDRQMGSRDDILIKSSEVNTSRDK